MKNLKQKPKRQDIDSCLLKSSQHKLCSAFLCSSMDKQNRTEVKSFKIRTEWVCPSITSHSWNCSPPVPQLEIPPNFNSKWCTYTSAWINCSVQWPHSHKCNSNQVSWRTGTEGLYAAPQRSSYQQCTAGNETEMKTKQPLYLRRSPTWLILQNFGMCYRNSAINLCPWVLERSQYGTCPSIFKGRHSEVRLPENCYKNRRNLIHVQEHRITG